MVLSCSPPVSVNFKMIPSFWGLTFASFSELTSHQFCLNYVRRRILSVYMLMSFSHFATFEMYHSLPPKLSPKKYGFRLYWSLRLCDRACKMVTSRHWFLEVSSQTIQVASRENHRMIFHGCSPRKFGCGEMPSGTPPTARQINQKHPGEGNQANNEAMSQRPLICTGIVQNQLHLERI